MDGRRERLHSGIGYVTPQDKLQGRDAEIFAERDRKLEEARARRAEARARNRAEETKPAVAEACQQEKVPA